MKYFINTGTLEQCCLLGVYIPVWQYMEYMILKL